MASEPRPQNPLDEDFSLFLSENGHLSFENPNYQMSSIDPSRLDDHLNSNIQPSIPVSVYEELKQELDTGKIRSGSGNNSSSGSSPRSTHRRRNYANMDVSSMGVDVTQGPTTTLDNKLVEEKMQDSVDKLDLFIQESSELTRGEIESDKLVETAKEKPEKSDGEVDTKEEQAEGQSPPGVKRRPKKKRASSNDLPPGWERHEDDEGPYFWHVKSGNIQREPPEASSEQDQSELVRNVRSSRIFDEDFDPLASSTMSAAASSSFTKSSNGGTMSKSCTSSSIADIAKEKSQLESSLRNGSNEWKRRSMPAGKAPNENDESNVIQVQVHSLGWVELREDELTPENSSKAVNRCIVQLSSGTNPHPDPVGQWGKGKQLRLEISEGSLRLVQPASGMVLNSQPIHSIRVWGVGRDNGRDFAYVARDKHTRKHMCHVFRCDAPARAIANALRDICKKILIERSLAQSSSKLGGVHSHQGSSSMAPPTSSNNATPTSARRDRVLRPTSLGANFNTKLQTKTVPAPESFPTPMEEPRKLMKAHLLGYAQVNKPCGIDVIHSAINQMLDTTPRSEWKAVSVAVAPSTVTISFSDPKEPDHDCRVRFLSFLGIGENVQHCAYIMHTAQDTFVCYAFHVEPCAGPLCKTIEAACKLRYQKCLDARPQRAIIGDGSPNPNHRGSIGATIKNMFGNWTGKNRLQSPPS
eukprot:snap_masked-scaffold182_size278544-processed-gene-1.6 protein:Tk04807 transcript:snap_masked-scaffold182_size278544-processed-gene-1.6-mRNA-1 annotation:"amyloid beta a4 precursor protein-binding family b member 2-like isoform x3"